MSVATGTNNGSVATGGLFDQVPACVARVCYEYEGIIMSRYMTPTCIEHVKRFKIRADDVFIMTYPKTGTTWAQQIMLLVKFDGDESKVTSHIMEMVPFLEIFDAPWEPSIIKDLANKLTFCEIADKMPTDSFRILKTHVEPKWLPAGVKDDPKCKVVYVARNPKDTAVSYFHFYEYIKELPNHASWSEFFEEFINDRAVWGSWFVHTLYWWNLRDHPNVLFLTYEGMKQDASKAVRQIAEFMGKSFSDDVINRIVAASSFKSMKNNPKANLEEAYKDEVDTSGNKSFFRKGSVGDWKNYFTVEQNCRFDELYKHRIGDSGLELIFE